MPLETVNPKKKSDIDPNFQRQVDALTKCAKDEAAARQTGGQAPMTSPDLETGDEKWSGDLFDFNGMHRPFNREQANENFLDAVKEPRNPGTSGDLIATTTQIDFLANMERAWRARHTMRLPRALAHTVGRQRGAGNDSGPLKRSALDYVRGILKQNG